MRHKPRWLPLGTPPPRRYPHGVPRGSGRSGGRSDHGHEGDRVSPRPRSRRRRRHRAHSRRRRPGAQPRPAADAGVLGLGSTTDQPRRGLNRQRPCSHTEFPSRTSHNGVRPVCAWTVVRYRRGGLVASKRAEEQPARSGIALPPGVSRSRRWSWFRENRGRHRLFRAGVLPVPATHHKAAQLVVVAVLHCSPVPFVAARSCDGVAGSGGAAALA
jgi:hypothetical protein